MKKSYQIILGVIVVIVALVLGIHALNSSKKSAESSTITVGSMNTDYQVWKHIAESKEAKKLGLKIKVKSITDGVQLNNATAQG